jgi:hypothetical protein
MERTSLMDSYEQIEEMVAQKYGEVTTTRKSIGDFMVGEDHAVNVKSNNVDKKNYSPNMISIKRMFKWIYEDEKELSFVFVDYKIDNNKIVVLNETGLIPMWKISWDCMTIEAQGYGVIQKHKQLVVDGDQTKEQFYEGFLKAYEKFREKELRKHEKFSQKLYGRE